MAASTKVSDMCRLCGTDTLNVVRHHIFEGEGQVKKSAQKISECLPLHIAAEDPLPKNICGECSYKLDLMSDFREKAVKTDVMLVSLVEGVKPEIPDDDDDGPDHEIDNDFRSDTPVEQPEQQTEPEVLIKEEEAQQPQQPEKRPGRKAANKRPIQESDMEEEEEEAPAKKRGRKPKEKETAPAASATTSASTNPPKENTGAWLPRKCEMCGEAGHDERDHGDLTPLECDWCEQLLWTKHQMESHQRRHLREANKSRGVGRPRRRPLHNGPFPCSICEKTFKHQGQVKIHMRLHTGERPFACSQCDKAYATRNRLNLHVKRTHMVLKKEHSCEVCGKQFENHSTLMFHRKIHFPDSRTEKCEVCGWSTYSKGNLKKHMATHATERPYVCDECGKRFTEKFILQKHREVHRPDRQVFKCHLCEKTFSTQHSLKNHVKRHQGLLNYECDLCDAAYSQINYLLRHKWEKHKVMPYKCETCDKGFTHLRLLKNHCIEEHFRGDVIHEVPS
ncbi:zinc finger protein 665-like isoform X25 [Cloeon dipterum]|uniref:zinc finger protein 665-like isoform X25 n=1 Tax=Cloeon dipterum TaxID=197152 RepID=UPI0032208BB3